MNPLWNSFVLIASLLFLVHMQVLFVRAVSVK